MPTKLKIRADYLVHWDDGSVSAFGANRTQLIWEPPGTFTPEQFTAKIKEWRRQGLLTAGCQACRDAQIDQTRRLRFYGRA